MLRLLLLLALLLLHLALMVLFLLLGQLLMFLLLLCLQLLLAMVLLLTFSSYVHNGAAVAHSPMMLSFLAAQAHHHEPQWTNEALYSLLFEAVRR